MTKRVIVADDSMLMRRMIGDSLRDSFLPEQLPETINRCLEAAATA